MMYRPHIESSHSQQSERSEPNSYVGEEKQREVKSAPNQRLHFISTFSVIGIVATALAIYGFYQAGHWASFSKASALVSSANGPAMVEKNRLCRDQIPKLDLNTLNYRELFNDTNATQLVAAKRHGLKHPELVTDPTICDELFPIASTDLYIVDTMKYSKPYLVPDAVRMLEYIGERFQQLMQENYPDKHYRIIVTSALRSQNDVSQLRRRNRNATEVSCHCYGTTIDITYIRFRDDNGTDANELYLKNMLAQTLYELRYEGICYVKYERVQGCFHLTLLNPEYCGNQKSERLQYAALSREHPTQTRKGKHTKKTEVSSTKHDQVKQQEVSAPKAKKQVLVENTSPQKKSPRKNSQEGYTNLIAY